MADFCKQCAEKIFGKGTLSDFEFDKKCSDDMGYHVLCEGCGPSCWVDENGICKSPDCLEEHGSNN